MVNAASRQNSEHGEDLASAFAAYDRKAGMSASGTNRTKNDVCPNSSDECPLSGAEADIT